MGIPLLTLQNIALTFGGTPLLEDASLSVTEGDRICIVGRNGSGKSTLMKIAAGLDRAGPWHALRASRASRCAICRRSPISGRIRRSTLMWKAGLAPGDDPHRARMILDDLGLTGEEEPGILSGGEARRAALAKTLAPNPDVLLLDEPTNHLDIQVIEWLEKRLGGHALGDGSHQPRPPVPVQSVAQHGLGGSRRHPQHRHRLRRSSRLGATRRWPKRNWSGTSSPARSSARPIGCATASPRGGSAMCAGWANCRPCASESAPQSAGRGQVKLEAAEGALSGKLVIEAKAISKSFGAAIRSWTQFSIRVHRGDRVGIAGPNGAGKTTLINMLIGKLAPDEGTRAARRQSRNRKPGAEPR